MSPLLNQRTKPFPCSSLRRTLPLACVLGGMCASAVHGQAGELGTVGTAAFGGLVDRSRIVVQFVPGSARVGADGVLEFQGEAAKKFILPGGRWSRVHEVSDDELTRQREIAQAYWNEPLPDFTQTFEIVLSDGADFEAALDALRAMPHAEYALPGVRPAPAPLPPDHRGRQAYRNAAPAGVGQSVVAGWPGGTGAGLRVCDLEYSWNPAHADLPTMTRLGNIGVDPFGDTNHGSAVMGELVSVENGWGTTGIVPGAAAYYAPTNFASGYNLPGAITTASNGLRAGDVMVIEQQWGGPRGGSAYVPVEWYRPNYDSIRLAVGNGRVVVEAAGNGGENLDDPIFSQGNGGHYPFRAGTDSGAIIVGAGCAPAANGGSSTDRSRLGFSCYGSRVNVQGWGERVTTLGYGDLYNAQGINYYYTAGFSGTSSASPIVTGACVLVQSIHRAVRGSVLTPAAVRAALIRTGSPQQNGANPLTQHIGPRPNTPAALADLFGNADCNVNGIPDAVDIAMGTAPDLNGNGIPDVCDPCDADFNSDGTLDFFDYDEFVTCFEGGDCPAGASSDFNDDGTADFFDYDDFVAAFAVGC